MRTAHLCVIYLTAIAGAELVTALVDSLGGVIFHFIILFLLISSAAIAGKPSSSKLSLALGVASGTRTVVLSDGTSSVNHESARGLFLALGLAPLIRILSLAMPLAEFSEIYWYLIISVPLLVGIFAVITAIDLDPRDVGLTIGALPLQLLVGLAGIGFGLVEYFILKPEPLISALRWQEVIVPFLILLVATGLVEELAFRGVMQRASAEVLGSWGWVFVAVLFTVLQIGHLSALHCLFVFPVALLFGWVVKRTGSIIGVSLSHGLVNIGLYLIFPFVFG